MILAGIGVLPAVVPAFQHLLPRGDESRATAPRMAPAGTSDGRQPSPAVARIRARWQLQFPFHKDNVRRIREKRSAQP